MCRSGGRRRFECCAWEACACIETREADTTSWSQGHRFAPQSNVPFCVRGYLHSAMKLKFDLQLKLSRHNVLYRRARSKRRASTGRPDLHVSSGLKWTNWSKVGETPSRCFWRVSFFFFLNLFLKWAWHLGNLRGSPHLVGAQAGPCGKIGRNGSLSNPSLHLFPQCSFRRHYSVKRALISPSKPHIQL